MPTPTVGAIPATPGSSAWFDSRAVAGNALHVLPSGPFIDQARQRLIRGARRSLYIAAYAWEDDPTGTGYLALLAERARAGVDIKLMVDSFGAKAIQKYADRLRAEGVRTLFFNPAPWDLARFLKSMHEKLVIADGAAVILGGSGFSDYYRMSGRDDPRWYDLDLLVEGPAAAWFHDQFCDRWRRAAAADRASDTSDFLAVAPTHADWIDDPDGRHAAAAGAALSQARYGLGALAPAPPEARAARGPARVLPLYGSPYYSDDQPILATHLAAIAATRDGGTIDLYSPYCVPMPRFSDALIAARARGVRVRILTNSRASSDSGPFVPVAMYEGTRALRRAGVSIHQWPRASHLHRKGGVFDRRWAWFGSDNLDRRGAEQQSETVAFTDDPATVAALAAALEADLALAGPPIDEAFVERDLAAVDPTVRAAAETFAALV